MSLILNGTNGIIKDGNLVFNSQGARIKGDFNNSDYHTIQEWLALGNTPIPEFTAEELLAKTKQELTSAIQQHLDSTAQSKGYDNIISACSYASHVNQFQQEAIIFLQWRSDCWATAINILNGVQAGTREIPTVEELISLLPTPNI